jgi:hypothetical protein
MNLMQLKPGMFVQVTTWREVPDEYERYPYQSITWQAVAHKVGMVRGSRYIEWVDNGPHTWFDEISAIEAVEGPLTRVDTEVVDDVLYGWIWE